MKRILLILLALMPILNIYCLPFSPDIPLANLTIIILVFFGVLNRKIHFGSLPKIFLIYWAYIGVTYFFLTIDNFKIVNVIPGGLSFCIWVLILSVLLTNFEFEKFRRYYRIVFLVCGLLLITQEFLYFTTGQRFTILFPLPLSGGMSTSMLQDAQLFLTRSSSFFREPSQFAQFSLPLLAIELLYPKKKNTFISGFSLFIILCLVVLRSGNGFLGMVVLLSFRFWNYFKNVNWRTKIATMVFVIPILIYGTSSYSSTDQGQEIFERLSNLGTDEDSESYDRTFRGYVLFQILPDVNKVFGISQENLESFIGHSAISYLFMSNTSNGQNDTYLNGIQYVLVHFGIIGLLLFLSFFISLFIHSNYLGKTIISTFLVIMLVGNLYASHMMLLTVLLSYKNKNKIIKRSDESFVRT